MKVELIGLTKPSASTGCNTADELVAYTARVSNPTNQNNNKTAPKLLKYLIKNEHWSPFEMVSVQMSITTTRDISRQIIRHRSFSFQEYSQRYAEAPEQIYTREARLQDPDNRQNSISSDDVAQALRFRKLQEKVGMEARTAYIKAQSDGISKEQSKDINKIIKNYKMKVQSQIQGEQIRVTGKKIDDLQDVMQKLKAEKIDIALQFINFKK